MEVTLLLSKACRPDSRGGAERLTEALEDRHVKLRMQALQQSGS